MSTPHINIAVLAHELGRRPHGAKSQVAMNARITPGHLSDLETGRNAGTNPDLRDRLAFALQVDVNALTCWCDRPNRKCRTVLPIEGAA